MSGWTPPEQGLEDLVAGDADARTATTPGPAHPAEVPAAAAVDLAIPNLKVFDRPLTTADVVDGSFSIIKERARTIAIFGLVFVVPLQLLVVVISGDSFGVGTLPEIIDDPELYFEDGGSGDSFGAGTFWALVLQSIIPTLVAAPLAHLVEGWYLGVERSPWRCLRRVRLKAWVGLLVGWVIVHVLMFLGFFALGLGSLVVMGFSLVLAPAIAIEGLGPFAGIKRSWGMSKPHFWRALNISVLSGIVATMLGLFLPLAPVVIMGVFDLGGVVYVAGVASVLTSLLTVPFVAGCAVLAYFDMRVRSEGLDLQLRMGDLFDQPTDQGTQQGSGPGAN